MPGLGGQLARARAAALEPPRRCLLEPLAWPAGGAGAPSNCPLPLRAHCSFASNGLTTGALLGAVVYVLAVPLSLLGPTAASGPFWAGWWGTEGVMLGRRHFVR